MQEDLSHISHPLPTSPPQMKGRGSYIILRCCQSPRAEIRYSNRIRCVRRSFRSRRTFPRQIRASRNPYLQRFKTFIANRKLLLGFRSRSTRGLLGYQPCKFGQQPEPVGPLAQVQALKRSRLAQQMEVPRIRILDLLRGTSS